MKISFPSFGKPAKTNSPAMAALKTLLSTPEGCEQALAEANAKYQANKGKHFAKAAYHQRRAAEFQMALDRHRLAGWHKAADQAMAASFAEASKSRSAAEQALTLANDELQAAEQRLHAIDARLEPLTQQLDTTQAAANNGVERELAKFNEVMLQGLGEEAEAKASKLVFEARQAARDAGGPIALRIDALKAQRADLQAAALAAKAIRDSAESDLHKACAALLCVESDQAAKAALEASIAAIAAIRKAGALPPGFKHIDAPILQFSRQSHAVCSTKMDAYSNRITPAYVIQEMILLAADVRYDLILAPEPSDTLKQGEDTGPEDVPGNAGAQDESNEYAGISDEDNASNEQLFDQQTEEQNEGERA